LKASNATSSRNTPAPSRQGTTLHPPARLTVSPRRSVAAAGRAYSRLRRDIADIALAGQIVAPHYARPLIRIAADCARAVYKTQDSGSEIVAELRPGDEFAMLDMSGDWAWGYRRLDHHVGYVPQSDLIRPDAED
jgi:hypothetical protein